MVRFLSTIFLSTYRKNDCSKITKTQWKESSNNNNNNKNIDIIDPANQKAFRHTFSAKDRPTPDAIEAYKTMTMKCVRL